MKLNMLFDYEKMSQVRHLGMKITTGNIMYEGIQFKKVVRAPEDKDLLIFFETFQAPGSIGITHEEGDPLTISSQSFLATDAI